MEFQAYDSDSPILIGDINDNDVAKEVSEPSYIDAQQKTDFSGSFFSVFRAFLYKGHVKFG